MDRVEYYAENVYTKEYYLTQYVSSRVFLRKKYCYMLLTESECNMLKERIPNITIHKLYEILESEYIAYELYQD